MHQTLGILLTCLLLLTACTGTTDAPVDDSAPDPLAPIEPTWSTALKPIGQPRVTGEVVVIVVTSRKRELDIVGLAADSGDELWRFPWSPGDVPTGYHLSPAVVTGADQEEYVVFQRPKTGLSRNSSWDAPVVVVAPATGEVVGRTRPLRLTTPLSECEDEVDACARGEDGSAGEDRTTRITVPDARVRPEAGDLPDGAFDIGPVGLYARYDERDATQVGRVVDGETAWEVLGSTVFPAGRGPSGGWSFRHDEKAGVFFGDIGMEFPAHLVNDFQQGEPVSYELASFDATVAIDVDTGESLWQEPGASVGCADAVDRVEYPARCRWQGTITEQQDKQAKYDDLEVTFEGFDPASGEVRWSRTVRGDEAELARDDAERVFTGDGRVLTIDGERVALSFGDGSIRPVGAEETFRCDVDSTFRYAVHGEGQPERSGGTLSTVCDRDGEETDGPLPRGVVEAVDSDGHDGIDGWRFIALNDEVRGYQL